MNECTPEECEELLQHFGTPDREHILQAILREQLGDDALKPNQSHTHQEWINRTFALVQARIAKSELREKPMPIVRRRAVYWQVAATVTGFLLLAGVGYKWLGREAMITEKTGNGEIRTIRLPDESTVVLNGNSTLKYPEKWTQNREVWLDGEAYFAVEHTADDRRFLVHASDQCSVEVLGTEFNVSDRPSQTRVALEKGSIKFKVQQKGNNRFSPPKSTEMLMKPGELIEFSEQTGPYYRKAVKIGSYSAWRDHKLVLNNTSLSEIAQILKETYGLTVQIPDSILGSQKVSGSISTENEARILKQLEQLFSIQIDRHGQTVRFHSLR